ncbi:MAG: PKD domain-containing protein [Microscillaceae bacterium]|nr:PKD domain-containing protein [Microscillaceae bacterium]
MRKYTLLLFFKLFFGFFLLLSGKVWGQCTASFTTNPSNTSSLCAPATVQFNNQSTPSSGLEYEWDFGDGTPLSSERNPSHTFDAIGSGNQSFTVRLKVKNPANSADSCEVETSQTITIKQSPQITLRDEFGAEYLRFGNCENASVSPTFTINFFDNSGPGITQYRVSWGDGSPDYQGANPPNTHTYSSLGLYTITYTIVGTNACERTRRYPVLNISNPSIGTSNPGNTIGCGPSTITFPIVDFINNDPSTIYRINPGDGSPIVTLPHPPPNTFTHTYSKSSCPEPNSSFAFRVTAVNACDSSFSEAFPIRIFTAPEAAFEPQSPTACTNNALRFVNQTQEGFNNNCVRNTRYEWNFGDGSAPLTVFDKNTIQHVYSTSGTYSVTLKAINSCDSSSISRTVTICNGTPTSSFLAGTNNTPSSAECGSGAVELTLPGGACILNNTPLNISLTDNSTADTFCSSTYTWSIVSGSGGRFSNGQTSSSTANEQFVIAQPGTYIIQQAVTNACGTSRSCIKIVVRQAPTEPTIQGLQASYCPGTPVDINTPVNSNVENYLWGLTGINGTANPDLGSLDLTQANLSPINELPEGTYRLDLSVANSCGTLTVSDTFDIIRLDVVALSPGDTVNICPGDSLLVRATAGLDTYQWFKDGRAIPNQTRDSLSVEEAGDYYVSVGIAGCPSFSDTIHVDFISRVPINAGADLVVCVNDSLFTLIPQSSVSGVWTGTGVVNDSIFNPSLASIGDNRVIFTVRDSISGCFVQDEIIITVRELPIINAGGALELCNVNEEVILTDFSPVGGQWSGTGITNSSGVFNPFSAGGVGNYTLTYTFQDSNGCSNSATRLVSVIEPTSVEAGADSSICQNNGLLFLNGSPNGGTWSGSGVNASNNSFDPAAVAPGDYKLFYSLGTGTCQTIDSLLIRVIPFPIVEAGNPMEFCENDDLISLNGQSPIAGGLGTWSGSGVATNGVFDPRLANIGLNQLIYTFADSLTGCINQDILEITIHPLPSPNFVADSIYCVNGPIEFMNSTPAITNYSFDFAWDFGDGTNSSQPNGQHTYANIGTYTIRLRASTNPGNCEAIFERRIRVVNPPQASFTKSLNPTDGCGDVTVNFSNNSTASGNESYFWDFGNGQSSTELNPSMSFRASLTRDTSYTVTLTISEPGLGNACNSAQFQDIITVKPLPKANFIFVGDFNPVCSGYPLPIDNFSFGNPTRFEWDFGDGTTFQNNDTSVVIHRFFYTGDTDTTYQVTLRAFNDCGVNEITRPITVLPNMVRANIELDVDSVGCAPHTVQFTSNQSGFNRVDWSFGDGNIAIDAPNNITYTYNNPGEYLVRLTVQNGCNIDNSTIKIRVQPSPQASFSSENALCLGQPFNFVNNSAPNLATLWDFGDGTSFPGRTPLPKIYENPGTYEVSLTVRDPENACTNTQRKTIEVLAPPVADFEAPVNACQGETVNFTNLSTEAIQYLWDFGEPNADPDASNPSHTFNRAGQFQVKLIAFNNRSCADTLVRTISIFPVPVPDFKVIPGASCITPLEVNFENLTSNIPPNQGVFVWDFGNGNSHIGSGNIPTQEYINDTDTIQNIIVRLSLTNSSGCSSVVEKSVEVCPKPCEARIVIPNAFTPNGDGLNDTFKPISVAVRNYRMQIFNRWGQQIFESTEPSLGWDGKRNDGSLYQEDMYVYKITYTCGQAQEESPTGDLLLIYKD